MEHRYDPWLVASTLAILGASLLTLGSLDSTLVGRQLFWIALGLAISLLASAFDAVTLARLSGALWTVAVVALAAVLVFGSVRGGTRGWFAVGGFTVQPSEFARLGVAAAAAALVAKVPGGRLGLKDSLLVTAAVAVPVGLVLLEPDLGVALTYLPILAAVLWLGGLPRAVWVAVVVAAILVSGAAWHWVLADYQKERVLTVLDPGRDPFGAGYQVRQSKIAVGSGEITGTGLGRGGQSVLRFLPARHTDFAFAVWAEATGFAGSLLLLGAYAVLLWRLARIGLAMEDRFGLLFCGGILGWLGFQLVVNVGMVVGWLPITGVTLPLFSYGGSSMLASLAALGLVQGLWRHRMVNQ